MGTFAKRAGLTTNPFSSSGQATPDEPRARNKQGALPGSKAANERNGQKIKEIPKIPKRNFIGIKIVR